MKIYVGHSKSLAFKKDLYPVFHELGKELGHTFILPHENSDKAYPSKTILPTCDLMIADVSLPALGLGIEIGWANMMEVPIVFIHQKENEFSKSIQEVSTTILSYESPVELRQIVKELLSSM